MKDQYFGDINDYRKYGLLRLLTDRGRIPLTVCWMLTPSDGRSDGSSISYLAAPERWRRFDPPLYDSLCSTVSKQRRGRTSSAVRLSILPNAGYFGEYLGESRGSRAGYFERLADLCSRDGLLFFDPDNGMEVRSVRSGRKNSSKYLYWEELRRFLTPERSLLIYQHFPRRERMAYMREFAERAVRECGIQECFMFKSARVLFVLLTAPENANSFAEQIGKVAHLWKGQLSVFRYRVAAGRIRAQEVTG